MFNRSFGGKGGVNCVLHPRKLSGDFNALARRLSAPLDLEKKAFAELSTASFASSVAGLTGAEKDAANAILSDMKRMKAEGMNPVLRVVGAGDYRDESRYDRVHDFHVDGDTKEGGYKVLCCYTSPVTEGLRVEDAELRDDGFYAMKPGAEAFRFKPGDIWRQAVIGTGNDIFPFIHRAPPADQKTPRLMLIADHYGGPS
jgi:hypothetical protein